TRSHCLVTRPATSSSPNAGHATRRGERGAVRPALLPTIEAFRGPTPVGRSSNSKRSSKKEGRFKRDERCPARDTALKLSTDTSTIVLRGMDITTHAVDGAAVMSL